MLPVRPRSPAFTSQHAAAPANVGVVRLPPPEHPITRPEHEDPPVLSPRAVLYLILHYMDRIAPSRRWSVGRIAARPRKGSLLVMMPVLLVLLLTLGLLAVDIG